MAFTLPVATPRMPSASAATTWRFRRRRVPVSGWTCSASSLSRYSPTCGCHSFSRRPSGDDGLL